MVRALAWRPTASSQAVGVMTRRCAARPPAQRTASRHAACLLRWLGRMRRSWLEMRLRYAAFRSKQQQKISVRRPRASSVLHAKTRARSPCRPLKGQAALREPLHSRPPTAHWLHWLSTHRLASPLLLEHGVQGAAARRLAGACSRSRGAHCSAESIWVTRSCPSRFPCGNPSPSIICPVP